MVLPVIADIAWVNDWDFEFRSGSGIGRLGAQSFLTGVTPAVEARSGTDRKALHFPLNGGNFEAQLMYPVNSVKQFGGQQFGDTFNSMSRLYHEIEMYWNWDAGFSLSDGNRIQFFRYTIGAQLQGGLSIGADRHFRLFSNDQGTQLGNVSLPAPGSTFKLRLLLDLEEGTLKSWFNETAGYPDSGWVQCADFSGISFTFRPSQFMLECKANYNETDPLDIYYYSCGFYCEKAEDPDNAGVIVNTIPVLSNFSEDEKWNLIKHDPWRQCMTLDATRTAFSARVQMQKSRLSQSWLDFYHWIEYAESEEDLLEGRGIESPGIHALSNPGVSIGQVTHHKIYGLKPGKYYYWRPVLGDTANSSSATNIERGPVFRVRTGYAAGSGEYPRYLVTSCAKTWGRFRPIPSFYVASSFDVDRVIFDDDVFYLDEEEFDGEGGAAYLWHNGHTRLVQQALEDPLWTPLTRKASFFLQFGDHDFGDNNWDYSWWNANSSDSLTASKYTNETSPTKGELIENGVSWWNASFADGFFNFDVDDLSSFSSVPYRMDRRHWRYWEDGEIDFIMLDTRMMKGIPGNTNDFLSDEQQEFVRRMLNNGSGKLKVIISSSPIGDLFTNSDNWAGHTSAREAFLDMLSNDTPKGYAIAIITGDRHLPFVARELRNGSLEVEVPQCLGEFNSCPAGSTNSHGSSVDEDSSDLVWRLRTNDGGVDAPAEPDIGDHIFSIQLMHFMERSVRWSCYDVDGDIMVDQDSDSAAGPRGILNLEYGVSEMGISGTVKSSPSPSRQVMTVDVGNGVIEEGYKVFFEGGQNNPARRIVESATDNGDGSWVIEVDRALVNTPAAGDFVRFEAQ